MNGEFASGNRCQRRNVPAHSLEEENACAGQPFAAFYIHIPPKPSGEGCEAAGEIPRLLLFMALKTNVYVDAFNLYYGCLRKTPYRWLNLAELCAAKIALARRWLLSAAGKAETVDENFWPRDTVDENFWPRDTVEWEKAETRLNEDGSYFIQRMLDVVDQIHADPFNQPILDEWSQRCSRMLPPHVFDRMITATIDRMGLPFLDPQRVRARQFQQWNDRLRLLDEAADIGEEAQRLVDNSLANDWIHYCPVDGDDVINRLHIPPGPRVRDVLLLGQQLWCESPCDREELLRRLIDRHVLPAGAV